MVDWILIFAQIVFSNNIQVYLLMRKEPDQLAPSQQYVLIKNKCFYINFWSTVHHYVLSNRTVTNNYDGGLDAQRISSSARYHASSNNKLHQISMKIIRGGKGGTDKRFSQNHTE